VPYVSVDSKEPQGYCAGCKYPLTGLATWKCPECGRPFDPNHADSFIRTPDERRRRRGLTIVVAVALVLLIAAGIAAAWLAEFDLHYMMLPYPLWVFACAWLGLWFFKDDRFDSAGFWLGAGVAIGAVVGTAGMAASPAWGAGTVAGVIVGFIAGLIRAHRA